MVTPFVLATLSRRAHQCPYGEVGGAGVGRVCVGAFDALVQFPDAVDYWSESDGASFGFFHSRS